MEALAALLQEVGVSHLNQALTVYKTIASSDSAQLIADFGDPAR
jgi:hypothetical protein